MSMMYDIDRYRFSTGGQNQVILNGIMRKLAESKQSLKNHEVKIRAFQGQREPQASSNEFGVGKLGEQFDKVVRRVDGQPIAVSVHASAGGATPVKVPKATSVILKQTAVGGSGGGGSPPPKSLLLSRQPPLTVSPVTLAAALSHANLPSTSNGVVTLYPNGAQVVTKQVTNSTAPPAAVRTVPQGNEAKLNGEVEVAQLQPMASKNEA